MASSDFLVQQLLQGQNQMVDPQIAALAPRMQLAQAMIQNGTDASPTNKWGGISRLASALVGNYGLNQAYTGMQNIAAQRQQDALSAGAFMNGAPPTPAPIATPPQPAAQPGVQVAPNTLPGVMHQLESGGSMAPGITGDGGAAAGPAQVHQGALDDVNKAQGTNYTLAQLTSNPDLGVKVGDTYLAQQQSRFPGRPDLALAAYNAGPTATQNAVNSGAGVAGLPQSTQNYVAKGTAMLGGGVPPSVTPAPVQTAGPGSPTGPDTGAQPPQTGANAPNISHGLQMIQRAQQMMTANPYNPLIQKQGQMVIDNAHTLMGLDTVVQNADGTQTKTNTGERIAPAAPLPHYVQTPTGSHDTTGQKPDTYMPSPRLTTTPEGTTIAVGSGSIPQVVAPANNAGVAARAAAGSQGTDTGKAAVATVGKMASLGGEADTAIGNIDYGMNQLHQAAAGGIQSGYFAPWLATAAAAGKSLGVNTQALGIDPQAVGNVQSAQKTLGVVAGAILQNAIGKDSAITDAKIEHFIHTQPGIETDPEAIQRVLGWARSQFTYNRGMAMDAMANVDPNSGMLPPGWQASYYKKAGAFAPIYDPLSQEMKQPEGQAPAPNMPAAAPGVAQTQVAPASAPSRADLEAEMRRRGLLK